MPHRSNIAKDKAYAYLRTYREEGSGTRAVTSIVLESPETVSGAATAAEGPVAIST